MVSVDEMLMEQLQPGDLLLFKRSWENYYVSMSNTRWHVHLTDLIAILLCYESSIAGSSAMRNDDMYCNIIAYMHVFIFSHASTHPISLVKVPKALSLVLYQTIHGPSLDLDHCG